MLESRSLNVKYGDRKPGEAPKFVHMLNGTLCATERALCCVMENYQTPDVSLPSFQASMVGMRLDCLRCAVTGSAYTQGAAAVHAGPGLYPVHAGPAEGHDVGQAEVRGVVVDRRWDGAPAWG